MNEDIFHHVISHLQPDPELYLTLSRISKYYYRLFTSDRLWQAFNVYNLKEDICKHYLESEWHDYVYLNSVRVSGRTWRGSNPYPDLKRVTPYDEMRYAWLGFLMNRWVDSPLPNTFGSSPEADLRLMQCLVRLRPMAMVWAHKWLSSDKQLASELIDKTGCCLQYFSEIIRGDAQLVKKAISTGCAKRCKTAGHGVSDSSPLIKWVSQALQQDQALSIYAVHRDWRSLCYAPKEVRQDPEIVRAALKQSPLALEFCEYVTRDLVLDAVQRDGTVLEYAREYADDISIVLASVTNCRGNLWYGALRFASETLKNNREVVLVAVNHLGRQLLDAPAGLRNDREIVLAAIPTSAEALKYAPKKLRHDKAFLFECIAQNERVFDYIKQLNIFDRDDTIKAIELNPKVIFHLAKWRREDVNLAMLALEKDGLMLDSRRPDWWIDDPRLMKIAIRTCPGANCGHVVIATESPTKTTHKISLVTGPHSSHHPRYNPISLA